MREDAGRDPQTADNTPDEMASEKSTEWPQTHKETQAEQMDRRQRAVAQYAQKKAIDALAALAPEDMTANEARQLLKTAQDIERRITEQRRDPEQQREEVQSLFERVWKEAKKK